MLTYGDGVSNVDLGALRRPTASGKLATITAVRPSSRFGGLSFEADGRVTFHREAPDRRRLGEWRLHGPRAGGPGFIQGDDTSFEQDVLEPVSEGQLGGFRHEGFWQPMDNIRDVRYLRGLWDLTLPHGRHGTSDGGRDRLVESRRPGDGRSRSPWSGDQQTARQRWCRSHGLDIAWPARPPAWIRTASNVSMVTFATAPGRRGPGRAVDRHRHPPRGADPRRAGASGPGRNISQQHRRDVGRPGCLPNRPRREGHRRGVIGQGVR